MENLRDDGQKIAVIGEGQAMKVMLGVMALMAADKNNHLFDIPTNPLYGMPTGGNTYGSDYNRIIPKDKWAVMAKHRNSLCECGSGKKYKHCCERKCK